MDNARFEIRKSRDDKYYYLLKAKNAEVMFVSETFQQKQSAIHAIGVVRESARDAEILDLTGEKGRL